MKLTHQQFDKVTVLTLTGDLTQEHMDSFRNTCRDRLANQARDFVLDMAGVQGVDSQGLEGLIWLREQCEESLGQVRLVGASDDMAKVLEITRLAQQFECHNDLDAAVMSLAV